MPSVDSAPSNGLTGTEREEYFPGSPKGCFAPRPGDRTLSIGIVGAGIAGLSAAIGLSRSGHDVEVFERSRFNNEIGAAINCCPNATRILRYWNFDFDKARPNAFGQGRFMKGDDLSTFLFNDHSNWENKFGAPGYFLHRVDLHNGLKDLTCHRLSTGKPAAKMRLATAVSMIDPEAGQITLADGEIVTKDLIIVADGVHSSFVSTVTGGETAALQTGTSGFRFLIPTEKLLEDEEARPLFEGEPSSIRAAVLGETRIVWYPCRNSTLQNGIVIFPTSSTSSTNGSSSRITNGTNVVERESWENSAPLSALLSVVRSCGFHRSLVAFCAQADPADLRLWPLLYRTPIEKWFRGRAVLVGDAAHPMLPHQGQAGAQAIEDGAALSVAFSHLPSSSSDLTALIASRLRLFQRIRRPRAAAMQLFSNAGQDQADQEKLGKELRNIFGSEGYAQEDVWAPRNPEEFHRWNFGWDCFGESVKVMRREVVGWDGDGPREE